LDPDTFQQLIREVKIQSFLNHPSIVKLYHFFVDEESAYLVLEPCLGKNLYQNLKENGKMTEKVVREYIRQVCTAVEYMHKNDIIHRDLKPENILLHEVPLCLSQNSIKICDFGWAVHSPMLRATQCGTPVYTSPEIVKKLPYDSKIDIWSIGILTYELLYGTIPFEIRHIDDLAKIVRFV
jgi:aurora kinase